MALGLTLDSEVVSLLADGDHRAAAVVKAARNAGALVHVPAVVLAEATTGDPGRDAKTNRVIKRLQVADADEPVGRTAGRLRYETGRPDATVDALVVATAAEHGGGRVVAVDPDVHMLARHAGIKVRGLPGREPTAG